MGIASVIGIFIQGFRSFALTFLRSSLGGEIANKKKNMPFRKDVVARSPVCADYFIVIINFRSDDLNFC